jgi:hypothetical protein
VEAKDTRKVVVKRQMGPVEAEAGAGAAGCVSRVWHEADWAGVEVQSVVVVVVGYLKEIRGADEA